MATSLADNDRDRQGMAWYQQAKFGLFIHWGAYAVAGVEASWPIMAPALPAIMFGTHATIDEAAYRALPSRFNPIDFKADDWVHTARSAGIDYIVFTAKHHDGFCMFDAPQTDYKITNTPFGRDVCRELAEACRRANMPLGFYYSPPDMHHPGYRDTQKPVVHNWLGEPKREAWDDYLDYMESHLRKLLTEYGDVRILWFDGLANHRKYDPPRFHHLIHELSPNTLVNDRLGDGYDFITPEQFIPQSGIPVRTGDPPAAESPRADDLFRLVLWGYRIPILRTLIRRQLQRYASGDLELTRVPQAPYPSPDTFQPWETCMTMGRSWAYNPHETAWKDPSQLIQYLVEVVSRGGHYLLNVGPTADGVFPPQALARLQAVGRWVRTYEDALKGSTYTPLRGLPWGQATRKGNKVFLVVFQWPADGRVQIDSFPGSVTGVRLFSGIPLEFRLSGQQLQINVPFQEPDEDGSVLVVDIDESEAVWREFTPST